MQYYTVFQLKNQFGGSGQTSIPTPIPGQFPGFTVTVHHPIDPTAVRHPATAMFIPGSTTPGSIFA